MSKLNKATTKKALSLNRKFVKFTAHNDTVRLNKMLATQRLEFLALQKMGINTAR